jgi:hypothetical protein
MAEKGGSALEGISEDGPGDMMPESFNEQENDMKMLEKLFNKV